MGRFLHLPFETKTCMGDSKRPFITHPSLPYKMRTYIIEVGISPKLAISMPIMLLTMQIYFISDPSQIPPPHISHYILFSFLTRCELN